MRENFQTKHKGKDIDLYEIESPEGYRLQLANYGCRLVSLWLRDQRDRKVDVLLGYDNIGQYLTDDANLGALVGRVANRIGNASFTLDGKKYQLTKNINGKHHLHGGVEGFASAVWEVEDYTKSSIILTHKSHDGDQGYPGNLIVKAVIRWTEEDVLQTYIYATTDKPTVANLTFHPYFNLMGEGTPSLDEHKFWLDANEILEFGEDSIATGNSLAIGTTPFNFQEITSVNFQEVMKTQWGMDGEGIDHFFVLNNFDESLQEVAKAEAENGLSMEIWTNQPGLQFYTANFLDTEGKDGKHYSKHTAFCLEAQVHPNAPNISHFPSVRLAPGTTYTHHTEYRFRVAD
ncbi:aldose 1-epimerase [Balneicella halophila]|uniref:Aldose 1-epimerase n=2 Tax=Balneicella halophila TaxID=1537566 RepID=A0A7L4UNX5_BALHA|nr:aldose 1-epimerase [Balneicella halophila]